MIANKKYIRRYLRYTEAIRVWNNIILINQTRLKQLCHTRFSVAIKKVQFRIKLSKAYVKNTQRGLAAFQMGRRFVKFNRKPHITYSRGGLSHDQAIKILDEAWNKIVDPSDNF